MTSKNVDKEYWVQVDGIPTTEQVEQLRNGVAITVKKEPYTTLPCQVETMKKPTLPNRGKPIRDSRHGPTTWLSITLREGKFRQVRKMTAKVGLPTLRLVRYRVGTHTLNGLTIGENALIAE